MFDYVSVTSSYGGPSKIDVLEKKAPTDDSMRLLSEMERKVIDKVVDSYIFEANMLKGVIVIVEPNPRLMEYMIFVAFEINGKKYESRFTHREAWKGYHSIEKYMQEFKKAFCEAIAEECFRNNGPANNQNIFNTLTRTYK